MGMTLRVFALLGAALLAHSPLLTLAQTGPSPRNGAGVRIDCRMTTAAAGLPGVTEIGRAHV